MLEDLGLRVIEEISTRLVGDDETWVQEFRVLGPDGEPLDLDALGDRVAELLAAVHRGDAETDNLNRLVITAGLDRRQVAILRAYRKYRQRVGSRFTESYQNDVLVANSAVTAKLVRFFELRFDPELETDEAAEAALRDEILADLDEVASLDHDRILRNQLTVIDATLRTNAYNADREALAFKLRSADVPAMPQPAPYRRDLRLLARRSRASTCAAAPIARGGLRWSDRQDYRTEVFGLMRAQLTKNAVIVPAGAKGGFYIKRRRRDGAESSHYVTFIRSLLSVTDNLVDGEVVHRRSGAGARRRRHVPRGRGRQGHGDVLRHRQPRLPASTASGSTTRSPPAGRRATTTRRSASPPRARGNRSSATSRSSASTPQADEFTVVGIGDMSGDVFGNGMLLCEHDPARRGLRPPPHLHRPDARRGRRLRGAQAAVRDAALVLGRLRPRQALRGRRRLPAHRQVDPAQRAGPRGAGHRGRVARAQRRHPRDPARAGRPAVERRHRHGREGVRPRATPTPHDRSSDAIRVDANELRAKVVGEGGNLGFTRRARVEYAAGGGRINADFIDNSAGVDCSDHEVNLKILLGPGRARAAS